jgi:hypothetical protein
LFLFLDPFGYSHAPMELTQDLVQQPKSDTLIFLPLSFVNRFKNREGQEVALDRFFGTPKWRRISDGKERPRHLLALFEAQLEEAGLDYVGDFRLRPTPPTNTSSSAARATRRGGRASRRASGPSTPSTAPSTKLPDDRHQASRRSNLRNPHRSVPTQSRFS